MPPVATDVSWYVCAYVTISCAKAVQPIEMSFGGVDSGRPSDPRFRRESRSHRKRSIFFGGGGSP